MNNNRSLKHNPCKKDLSDRRTGNHLRFSWFLFDLLLITMFIVSSENKITLISLVTDKIIFLLFSSLIWLLHFFFPFLLGVQLLALLVPTLISYLLNENAFASASAASKDLHEFALQNLMHIGPLYPHAFKTVIGAAPELKTRLETAVRASQASKAKAAARQPPPTVHSTPTIKLKTSFF